MYQISRVGHFADPTITSYDILLSVWHNCTKPCSLMLFDSDLQSRVRAGVSRVSCDLMLFDSDLQYWSDFALYLKGNFRDS